MCAVEMNLARNVTGMERLTLHYDSVEEFGWLACFKCLLFFRFEQDSLQNPVCRFYSSYEGKLKKR